MLKIIKDADAICISCGNKEKSTNKICINRKSGVYAGNNITSFHLCEDCLKVLAKEFFVFAQDEDTPQVSGRKCVDITGRCPMCENCPDDCPLDNV